MKKYEVEGHVPSYLPEGRNWKLVWNDEFDGPELDTSKWEFRLNFWGKRFAAYTDEGITFDGNSNILLHRVYKDGYYVSPQLQTGRNSFDKPVNDENDNPWQKDKIWRIGEVRDGKFMHRFGYYECRCKFQREPDVMWSAFWTQSPSIGMTYDPAWSGVESDIMEYYKQGNVSTGNIMGGYGKQYHEDGRVKYDLKPTDDGFHTFAMDWTPESYTFYCDGEIVSTACEAVSQVPQFILLTTEVQGYRKKGCEKKYDHYEDDAFTVDYVRVFDEAK